MKVKVQKLSDNKKTYDSELEKLDVMMFEPMVDACLVVSSSTNPGYGMQTSLVKEVEKIDNGVLVKTMNSVYEITYLEQQ